MKHAEGKRDPALDALRALAILMVLTIHAASSGLALPPSDPDWWGALLWGALARPAVPLFFMCSGALMLGRDIPLKRLFGHNVLRILAAMFVWAMVYKAARLVVGGGLSLAGLWRSLTEVLLLDQEFHFYYLHILLLVYAFLPAARVFVRSASRRELVYALGFWWVTGILFPLLRYFWPFTLVYTMSVSWYVMNMAYSAIGYSLLGHYLRQYGGAIPRKYFAAALAVGAAIVMAGSGIASWRAGALSEIFMEGMSPGPMLMAAGLMGLALTRPAWPEGLRKVTGSLARASFCIYLSHILFFHLLNRLGLTSAAAPLFTIPLLVVLMTALSWALYHMLRRIPWVRTWLI